MKSLPSVLVTLVLFCGCGASSSAYKHAEKLMDLRPVILTAVYALSDSGPEVASAFDAASALLNAYNSADAGRFDALLPCVTQALRAASAVLPADKAKALVGVAGVLSSLAPEAVCASAKGDEDGGVALWRRNERGTPEHVTENLAFA